MYLESNNLRRKYQSAFRCSHSTETALLKVFNDLQCYLDESRSVMYIGLDLSAAFDIIDHPFLFEILAKRIGLQSVVLLFIKNYLLNRSQQVIINGYLSGDVKVKTGVPRRVGSWSFTFFLLRVAFRKQAERIGNRLPFLRK